MLFIGVAHHLFEKVNWKSSNMVRQGIEGSYIRGYSLCIGHVQYMEHVHCLIGLGSDF